MKRRLKRPPLRWPMVLLLLLPLYAHAQTCGTPPPDPVPSWQVRWSWTAPTTNTDASPIVPPITYTVYEGATVICTTTATAAGWNPVPGVHSWAVTAKTAANGESAKSNMAGKTIVSAPPNPPGGFKVDPASLTAYQLVLSDGLVAFVAVGQVAPGTVCDTTQPVGNKYVVPRSSVASWFGNVKPQLVVASCG